MANAQDKEKLSSKRSELLSQISSQKKDLNAVVSKREAAFKKRNELRNQILEHMNSVKSLRGERDALTSVVALSKEERGKIIKRFPEVSKELVSLKKEREKIFEKTGNVRDFSRLKKEIERMELKIETEPMSFSREKKMMEQIKEKKKALEGSQKLTGLSKRIRTLAKELDSIKQIKKDAHEKVQETAKDSQEKHSDLVDQYKKIDGLREQEKAAQDEFMTFKVDVRERAEALKKIQDEVTDIDKSLGIDSESVRKEEQKKTEQSLGEQRKSVEEKMKKGGKLTTEDLLIMQTGSQ